MKNDASSPDTTSRRQFTRAVLTAVVAAPVAVSMVACKDEGGPGANTATTHPTPSPSPTGPTKEVCFPTGGGIEDHIPPMGFDGGGGSLLIETVGELQKVGPSYEEKNPSPEDKIGDLKAVRVITELAEYPFVTDWRYSAFPLDSELWLWYQFLKEDSGTDECYFDPIDFNKPPDVRIVGGRKAVNRPFRMTFPEDLKTKEKSHKCGRPHKYRQADKNGPKGHFRVCQWRIVDANENMIFQDNVDSDKIPEHFRFYVTFDDYNPHVKKS